MGIIRRLFGKRNEMDEAVATEQLRESPEQPQHTYTYDWKREQQRLWNELVPASGQADTLQGELIRVVGKLTDEAYRNANKNWSADYEKLWRFVQLNLNDPSVFTSDEILTIRIKVSEVIHNYRQPDISGDGSPYYYLAEKVVQWCLAHPTLIPHDTDPTVQL